MCFSAAPGRRVFPLSGLQSNIPGLDQTVDQLLRRNMRQFQVRKNGHANGARLIGVGGEGDYALAAIRPGLLRVRMQRVQALTLVACPSISTVVFWMFGRKTRLVRFFEKLTLLPKDSVFPQMSHLPATVALLLLAGFHIRFQVTARLGTVSRTQSPRVTDLPGIIQLTHPETLRTLAV